jgi:hypothetical protein
MIGAEEFIALLEKKDLVSPELIEHLRRQIARPQARMSATLIAKWLVDRGHLSRLLAERLLSRAEESVPEAAAPQEEPFSWEKQAEAEQEELGLAPLDDEIPSLRETERKKPAPKPEQPPQPTEPRPGAKPPKEEAARPVPAIPVVPLLEEEVTPVGPGAQPGIVPLDGLMDESSPTASAAAGPLAPIGRRKTKLFRSSRRTEAGRRSNVWDTPLMLIGGGALLALVILGGVLIWALRGRGADELLKMAEDDYRAGSYTQAMGQ